MATETTPLHSWKFGANARIRWPNRFTPDTFRRTNDSRAIARAEFFGAVGGQQIIEADANAAGAATVTGVGAAVWNALSSAQGAAANDGIAGALWNVAAAAAAASTVGADAAAIMAADGVSAGTSSTAADSAIILASLAESVGEAVASGVGEDVGYEGPVIWYGPGGPPLAKHQDAKKREAKERLREQLRTAREGPPAPERAPTPVIRVPEPAVPQGLPPQILSILEAKFDQLAIEQELAAMEEDDEEALITLA